MVFRIASIVLRVCGVLALLLGLLFWSGNAYNLLGLHMLLGVLVVLSLWVVGVGQMFTSRGKLAAGRRSDPARPAGDRRRIDPNEAVGRPVPLGDRGCAFTAWYAGSGDRPARCSTSAESQRSAPRTVRPSGLA